MLKLIAILVLTGNLQVAVEQQNGYLERSFPNSATGAQQLIEFAEKNVGEAPKGIRIVVGRYNDASSDAHIAKALSDLGISFGVVSPAEVKEAATASGATTPTAKAVAAADEKKFGFLYRRKK